MVVKGLELHEQIVGLSDGQGITRLDARQRHGSKGRRGTVHDELNAGYDLRLVFSKARQVIKTQLEVQVP